MTGLGRKLRDFDLGRTLVRAAEGGYFDDVGRSYGGSNGSPAVAVEAVRLARRLLGRDVPLGAAEEVTRYQREGVTNDGFNGLIAVEQELSDRRRARLERARLRRHDKEWRARFERLLPELTP